MHTADQVTGIDEGLILSRYLEARLLEARLRWVKHIVSCERCGRYVRGWDRTCDRGAVLLDELWIANKHASAGVKNAH